MLLVSYEVEVGSRGKKIALDDATREHITKAAEWLTENEGNFGLLLCGSVGNGKTTLARAIASIIELLTADEKERTKFVFVTAREVSAMTNENLITTQKTKFLIVDDIGQEPAEVMSFGNVCRPIDELISYRYDRQLFTIATTNLRAGELETKYGHRLYDRLREMFKVIPFENKSYR